MGEKDTRSYGDYSPLTLTKNASCNGHAKHMLPIILGSKTFPLRTVFRSEGPSSPSCPLLVQIFPYIAKLNKYKVVFSSIFANEDHIREPAMILRLPSIRSVQSQKHNTPVLPKNPNQLSSPKTSTASTEIFSLFSVYAA